MNFIKIVFRKLKNIFIKETVTIDELNQENLYKELLTKYEHLQKDYDLLNSDYQDLKAVLFSPLHVPNSSTNSNLFTFIIIALNAVILAIMLLK